MSFTGPLTQEDLWGPKILVAVEKGKKKKKKTNLKKIRGTVKPKPFSSSLATRSRSLEN